MTDFSKDLDEALNVLANGGIILYPTDTVWGLGCDATNPEAVEKVVKIKGKSKNGLITILGSERDVIQYVANLDLSVFNVINTYKNATTVIYENGVGVADKVLADDGSIAIRVVKEDFCRHLAKRFKKPIVSTSANFHNQPTPTTFPNINNLLKESVDYIVQYRQDDVQIAKPSSIIKVLKNGEILQLR